MSGDRSRGERLTRRDVLKGTGGLAAAVFAAPLAAACAPGGVTGPAASPKDAAPVKGGHLVEGQITGVTDLSPIRSGGGDKITSVLYTGLLALLADGGLAPRLAQSLPKVSADGMTYTFELRKDAKWTDGIAVTAEDVVFTYKLMYDPAFKSVTSPFRLQLEGIVENVTAPDPYTVVFKTKTPRAGFLTAHGTYGILPKSVLGSVAPAAINTHEYLRAPKVTNGPFKFEEWKTDANIRVVRNDAYFLGAPNLDLYVLKFADQNSVIEQLKTGEVDLFRANTFSRFDELAAQPNLDFDVTPTGAGPKLWFRLDPATPAGRIFSSKAVRQAIRYATDVEGYNNAVIFKRGSLPNSIGVFPPHSWANNPNGKPAYTFDKAKAQQMLDAEGWTRGPSGVRARGGVPLKFELLTSGDSQEWQQGAAIFQQGWKEVGADVAIRAPRLAQQVQALLDKDFEIAMQSSPYGNAIDPDPSEAFHSRFAVKGARNYSGYKNPQVDRLLDEAASTLDQAKRKALYFQLQDILNEDIPAFGTPFAPQGWAHNKRVRGVGLEIFSGYTQGTRWYLHKAYVTDGK